MYFIEGRFGEPFHYRTTGLRAACLGSVVLVCAALTSFGAINASAATRAQQTCSNIRNILNAYYYHGMKLSQFNAEAEADREAPIADLVAYGAPVHVRARIDSIANDLRQLQHWYIKQAWSKVIHWNNKLSSDGTSVWHQLQCKGQD